MIALERISKLLADEINQELFRVGLLFRSYYRYKSLDSVEEKVIRKGYSKEGKKIQDAIGIRINLYFVDDLLIVVKLIQNLFVVENKEIDNLNEETFKPTRTNIVFNIPDTFKDEFNSIVNPRNLPIDATFEVQIRSVLSEGWHEVEHDLRYKCKSDWDDYKELSRTLNGIYATIETGEWTMLKVFSELSYHNYRKQSWIPLLRNKFRLRFKIRPSLDLEIIKRLNEKPELGKKIFRIRRISFLNRIADCNLRIPITYNNLIYLLNHLYLSDPIILGLTPSTLQEDFNITLFKTDIKAVDDYFLQDS